MIKAEAWRGEDGERRKIAVYDYVWEEEEVSCDTISHLPGYKVRQHIYKSILIGTGTTLTLQTVMVSYPVIKNGAIEFGKILKRLDNSKFIC